jgi:hypothetical protein
VAPAGPVRQTNQAASFCQVLGSAAQSSAISEASRGHERLIRSEHRNNERRRSPHCSSNQREDVMAKGQLRSNKEKKKPKQNKGKKKGGTAPSPFAAAQMPVKPVNAGYGRKG